jgi:hypothetical protein
MGCTTADQEEYNGLDVTCRLSTSNLQYFYSLRSKRIIESIGVDTKSIIVDQQQQTMASILYVYNVDRTCSIHDRLGHVISIGYWADGEREKERELSSFSLESVQREQTQQKYGETWHSRGAERIPCDRSPRIGCPSFSHASPRKKEEGKRKKEKHT